MTRAGEVPVEPVRQIVRCTRCGEAVEIYDDYGHGRHEPVHTHRRWIGKPGETWLQIGVLECACERAALAANRALMGIPDGDLMPAIGDPAWKRLLAKLFPARALDPARAVPGPVPVSAVTPGAIPEGFSRVGEDLFLDQKTAPKRLINAGFPGPIGAGPLDKGGTYMVDSYQWRAVGHAGPPR